MYSVAGFKYSLVLTTVGVAIALALYGAHSTNKREQALKNVNTIAAAGDLCEISAEQVVDDVYFVHCGGFF